MTVVHSFSKSAIAGMQILFGITSTFENKSLSTNSAMPISLTEVSANAIPTLLVFKEDELEGPSHEKSEMFYPPLKLHSHQVVGNCQPSQP